MIIITLNTDNDAFVEALDREIVRCLSQVRVENGDVKSVDGLKLRDSNGNTVGTVEVVEEA